MLYDEDHSARLQPYTVEYPPRNSNFLSICNGREETMPPAMDDTTLARFRNSTVDTPAITVFPIIPPAPLSETNYPMADGPQPSCSFAEEALNTRRKAKSKPPKSEKRAFSRKKGSKQKFLGPDGGEEAFDECGARMEKPPRTYIALIAEAIQVRMAFCYYKNFYDFLLVNLADSFDRKVVKKFLICNL